MNYREFVVKNRSAFIALFLILFGFFLFRFFSSLQEPPKQNSEEKARRIVSGQIVINSTNSINLEGYGRLISTTAFTLSAEVNGQLEKGDISFLPGQKFKKGQVLLRIDDRETKYNLMSAKSQLLNALSTILPELKVEFPDNFAVWQSYFDHFDFNKGTRLLPIAENSRIKLFMARFNVYQLYYSVRNLEILLDKHRIRAPFDGAITTVSLKPGAIARAGVQLGQIIDLENREIEVPIAINDLKWLKLKGKVRVLSEEFGPVHNGIVARISSQVSQNTETATVYIRLNNDNNSGLISGQFLKVIFPPVSIENSFFVPEKAVYNDLYLYKVKEGKLIQTDISVIHHGKQDILIESHSLQGDTVITQSLLGVSQGLSVKVRLDGDRQ